MPGRVLEIPSSVGGPCSSTSSIMMSLVETSASDITLTPGTDGVSDYHQCVEKAGRQGSQGGASLVHSSSNEDGETLGHNSLMDPPAPTLDNETQLGDSHFPTREGIRPGLARKEREKRSHNVETTEDPHQYPGPLALSILTVGICLSVFLVSLDRTIIATVRASCGPLSNKSSELIRSTPRPYLASPMIFAPLTMLGGTAART